MEKSALAQEKVWFDKPSYDKAERLYFERMAKVVSRKIMDTCSLKSEICVTSNCQDVIINKPMSKRKSEKSKENKSFISENVPNDILKSSKCQTKALKTERNEDDYNALKKRNSEDKLKHDGTKNDSKEKELNSLNDALEKCHLKEPKEKKSKAETRHRNRGKGKHIENQETKDQDTSMIRNKDQLPNQGKQHTTSPILPSGGCLANEVAKVRQRIKQSLQCVNNIAAIAGVPNQTEDAKKDDLDLGSFVGELMKLVQKLEKRVEVVEENIKSMQVEPYLAVCPAKPATPPNETTEKKEDDDDVDLFGSDSEGEDAEAAKIREERLAAYAAKKSKKPVLIAKSNIILDVKPWDDETDMKAMEAAVRQIECNGLLWGAAQLVPLAYGIHKLQISCVVEDEKVSVDCLTEQILEITDYVQSVDIAAFNKV